MKLFSMFLILGSFFLYSCSCSKEEDIYTPTQMLTLAKKVDPEIELVPIPTHMQHLRVLCAHYEQYGKGCIPGSGKRFKVRKVEILVIRYETKEQAAKVAKAINQYYARNWVLDDVMNEPVLEDFVTKAFGAKKGADWVEE